MLIRGAEHEISNNRLELPYLIKLTMDQDHSLDDFAKARIHTHVMQAFNVSYKGELLLQEVKSAASDNNHLLQLADVIAGAANRKLNHKGDRAFKDEIAELIIARLNLIFEPQPDGFFDASAFLEVSSRLP